MKKRELLREGTKLLKVVGNYGILSIANPHWEYAMTPKPITQNTLFYGDSLIIRHDYIPTESIDLICPELPFNSNCTYSVLFKDESGMDSESPIAAFEDTWHWTKAIEELLQGKDVDRPSECGTFKQA